MLVALKNRAVVGGLVAYELYKLERARREIYLYDLAVAESHRRQGIATRLIERLRAIAHERGAWVVFVQADHGDDAAIALYGGGLGVQEEVLHFDVPVPLSVLGPRRVRRIPSSSTSRLNGGIVVVRMLQSARAESQGTSAVGAQLVRAAGMPNC